MHYFRFCVDSQCAAELYTEVRIALTTSAQINLGASDQVVLVVVVCANGCPRLHL